VGGPVAALIYELIFKMSDSVSALTPSTPRSQPYDGTGGAAANLAALEQVSILDGRTLSRAGGSDGDDMPALGLDGSSHRGTVSTSVLGSIPMGTVKATGAGQGGGVADWR
jgi:hypothetical protein